MKLLLMIAFALGSAERDVVSQKACTVLEGKKLEDAKRELLIDARRGAAEQLFGILVTSLTQVENLSLKRDEIQAASMGYLRIAGDPVFFNGQSLGELCVQIQAYATEEDRARLRPKELFKKTCIAEGDVTSIRRRTEEKAAIEALTDYDPTLKGLPQEKVLPLLHEIRFTEGGFVPETTTYCVKATGTLYPIEATAIFHQDRSAANLASPDISTSRTGSTISPGTQTTSPDKKEAEIRSFKNDLWRIDVSSAIINKTRSKITFFLTLENITDKNLRLAVEYSGGCLVSVVDETGTTSSSTSGSKTYVTGLRCVEQEWGYQASPSKYTPVAAGMKVPVVVAVEGKAGQFSDGRYILNLEMLENQGIDYYRHSAGIDQIEAAN